MQPEYFAGKIVAIERERSVALKERVPVGRIPMYVQDSIFRN